MKNRQLTIPIASMVALSLALVPLPAQTAFTAPSSTASGPVIPASTSSAPTAFAAPVETSATTSTSSPAPGVTVSTTKTAPLHAVTYTVVKGDSLTKLATKFNTTRKKLEALNDLPSYKLSPGQVIYVPSPAKSKKSAMALSVHHHTSLPVQDYDIPASTFAGCPVPPSNGSDSETDITATYGKPAPIAQLVSPSEMDADQTKQKQAAADAVAQGRLTANIAPPRLTLPVNLNVTSTTGTTTAPLLKKAKQKKTLVATTQPVLAPKPAAVTPAPEGWANQSSHPRPQQSSAFSRFFSSIGSHSNNASMDTPANDPSNEWGYKFLQTARSLGDRGIDYNDDWRPPGERTSWVMDCSNTSRWLYKSVANINLPRTASDQYYYLHMQGKAWDVPQTSYGLPDVAYLQNHLKPGDLLFWENTYRPERQPPITHVMVFLGTNERGQWIMAGSQGSGGEHGRSNGGPDVYVFRPSQPCGGYTSWFVHHRGQFCAFGRPLEADPSKFALND